MIMNYVLSFCKITAASRIFSRNFYLPLLKPLTPKDALRTFKITGKWILGSKIQHYIPVLLNHKKKRPKKSKNYGKIKHKESSYHTYMAPVLDPLNENHELLLNILKEKSGEGGFVYTVNDRMYNIVFSAEFELAIRNGDIIDIIVSQSNDKILIKLKNFKKIAVELDFYSGKEELFNGEGGTSIDEEQFHHYGQYTMKLAKIFEAKEQDDEWEMEMLKIVAKKRKQRGEGTQEWNEMLNESIQNLDWQQFEVDAKKVIDQIMEPVVEEHIGMQVEDLEKTKNVSEFILRNSDIMLGQLPTMLEIPDVVKNMANAVYFELEDTVPDESGNIQKISGVKVTLSSGKECFIPGQMVKSDDGDVFVPGQTINTDFGYEYAPGFTINMNNTPTLIKGLIMGEDNEKPMFLPTESTITSDGQLTFITNPSEREKKLKPKKIFVKRKKTKQVNGEKSKKKRKPEEELNGVENSEEITLLSLQEVVQDIINTDIIVEEEKKILEEVLSDTNNNVIEEIETKELVVEEELTSGRIRPEIDETEVLEYQKKEVEDDVDKPIDDGMNKVIANLEDKKSDLQEKLDALRKLTVTLENSVTYIGYEDAQLAAEKITDDIEKAQKLADILLTLTRRINSFRERYDMNLQNVSHPSITSDYDAEVDEKFNQLNNKLKVTLKSAMYAANEGFKSRAKDQLLALNTISDLLKNPLQDINQLDELCLLMNTHLDRNEVCTSILKELTQDIIESKVDILRAAVEIGGINSEQDVLVDKLFRVLHMDGSVFGLVFKKLAKNNHELLRHIVTHLKRSINTVDGEQSARNVLVESIIKSSRQYSEDCLINMFVSADQYEIKTFLAEAIGLSTALDMLEVTEELTELAEDDEINIMACDTNALDFLRRMTLVRKLCERDYTLKNALDRIRKKPECGRTDPRIRQLVVESALLLSTMKPIRNSTEVPLRLFQSLNWIAIEDYVAKKSGVDTPILISRRGIQAVVPNEASKNVLAGRVPYLLIDESGVSCLKPMHMFAAAMKLGGGKTRGEKTFEEFGGAVYTNVVDKSRESPSRRKSIDVRQDTGNMLLNSGRMVA